jgi:cohesin loading factor subunit SCC2
MNTNTYRLSNTTYSEVAPCLPLPNLPIYLGASSQDISLFEDVNVGAGNRSAVLLQAGKIAELLKITDISYLYVYL